MFESGATLIIVSYSASHKRRILEASNDSGKHRSLEKAPFIFEPKRKKERAPLNSLIFKEDPD